MKDINWFYVILGAGITILAQIGAWLQHNLQFKNPKYDETWWGMYVLAIPLTYVFILATKYNVLGYGGSIWAGRFVGFALGILVYAVMIQIFFKEPFTWKIIVQLILCLAILCVQAFWKNS
jgi:multidrug transporter EmrE-like cation transporter